MLLARRQEAAGGAQDLVTQILVGAAPTRLPPTVAQQLELLAAARRRPSLRESAAEAFRPRV